MSHDVDCGAYQPSVDISNSSKCEPRRERDTFVQSKQDQNAAHLAIGLNGTNAVTGIDLVAAVVASF